jgi:hypothetical protein
MTALHALGERLLSEKAAQQEAEREAIRRADAEALVRCVDLADRLARQLLGAGAPSRSAWVSYGAGMVLAPLGASLGAPWAPWDGEDGELILRRSPDELWYRPRLRQDSARITDLNHLARMVAARSIYE